MFVWLSGLVGDLGSQVEDVSVAPEHQSIDGHEILHDIRDSPSGTSHTSTTYVSENGVGELVVGDPFWSIFCKEVCAVLFGQLFIYWLS